MMVWLIEFMDVVLKKSKDRMVVALESVIVLTKINMSKNLIMNKLSLKIGYN